MWNVALGVVLAQVALDEPESRTGKYSAYELESIRAAELRLGHPVDPAPAGKTVEAIDVLPLDVIEPRDPAPQWFNMLFVTTKPYIVEREVLLRPGDRFRGVLCDETARNLRTLAQLSLVVCTATRGSAPDKVRVLVITKDVWSLRLSWNIALGPGGPEYLLIQPSVTNLLGRHQSAGLRYVYYPETHTLGGGYSYPRVLGSRVAFRIDGNLVLNKRTGAAEGSSGGITLGQPLWSTRTEWAWGASVSWRNELTRRYVNARVATYDGAATPGPDGIPWIYRTEIYGAGLSATRSYGWAIKNDISAGFDFTQRQFRLPDLSAYDSSAVAEFVGTRVPVSDTRVGPFLQYHAYTTHFMRVLDFETLGLQEDIRLGHEAYARVYPVTKALGSSRDFVGVFLASQYTWPLGDGLLRLALEWVSENQKDLVADASVGGSARVVTPRLGFGRLVFDAGFTHRYRNYLRGTSFLGGDGRLRGYPSNFFAGKDVVVYNVEFRTRPVEILSCQAGLAAFYDAGDAFDGFSARRMHHSVGGGLRALFPQLDRTVFRADIGFPLEPQGLPAGVSPVAFFVAFDQAFGLPRVAP